jgi:hypothetical protein
MSPGDAVDMHRLLLGLGLHPVSDSGGDAKPKTEDESEIVRGRKRLISLAVHFGTFCSGPAESRDTVRTLRRECSAKGVELVKRSGPESTIDAEHGSAFVVLDHGGTIEIVL